MRSVLIACLLFFSTLASSQIDQEIGEWRSFLPYNDGRWVTQSPSKVYYATGLSVFSINKSDVTDFTFKSKVEGLSDIGANRIEYDRFNDQLIITYSNSNIDIIKDDEVINLPEIKENLNLTGSRIINDVHIPNEESIFFATDFGIIELNAKNYEFTSTIFTNLAINDITSNGDLLYAATDDGIYEVNISTNPNIIDFSSWTYFDDENGLSAGYSSNSVEAYNGRLYAEANNLLYYLNDDRIFEEIDLVDFDEWDIVYLSEGQERLIIGLNESSRGRALFLSEDNSYIVGGGGCTQVAIYSVEDEQGRVWYADGFAEIRWTDTDVSGCNKEKTNSPSRERVSDIDIKDGALYIASGGVRENFSPLSNRDGFYILENGVWTIETSNSVEVLEDINFLNAFQIETHPDKNKVYVGSYFEGLLEYDLDDVSNSQHFGPEESALTGTVGDAERERVSGLAFDQNGTLWMNNFGAVTPLVAYTADSTWHAFNPQGDNNLTGVVVDDNGYTWSVLISSSGGVVVHNSNGTPNDPTDDQSRFINSGNSEITTGTINTVAVDLDGQIWVGTNQGPVIFDSGPSIFDNDNRGSRRTVLQDSIAAILLETEDILAIGIDGANRKWFGTRNGIFVQSPNGEELIEKFDVDNSPLFDNIVRDFKYDDENGIMYIATDKGLQSYRTETLGAEKRHSSTVFAYPNPVRPEYQGEIYIKGLARDANVKITDLNGKLVFETTALGGQAVWDGMDYTGRRAETGVYLVFSTGSVSFDTPDNFVTKIMIIN